VSVFVSADPSLLDFGAIHAFLTRSYWSPGIPREVVERAAANSLCFGVYDPAMARSEGDARPAQVGYARMITDRATYAYLADVYILESHRGRGLSKELMAFILAHPDLQGLRRMSLNTRDAHGLYAQFGFAAPGKPENIMERRQTPGYVVP
jgi:GNAT superfamily N-acetyltransferase